MKTITAVLVDGVITPSEPFSDSAIKIVFNSTEYVVYEEGDELPADNFE